MFHQVSRRLGKQDLPAVSCAHDTRGTMHVQAYIALGSQVRLTCMHAHPYSHRHTLRPAMTGERALAIYGCCNSITGARKSHEERITLRIQFMTVPLLERAT